MKKKIISMITATIMTIGMTTKVLAVTPQYHSWVPQIPIITWDSLSDESKEAISDAVSDVLEDIDFNIEILNVPNITQATYHHGRYFFDKTRLQVRWDNISEVDHYEICVTKSNGESKTYNTSNTALFIYEGSDDFISECIRGGTVEIRACKEDTKSGWSESKTISCNSFH